MSQEQIVTALVGPGFVAAAVALVRKLWPAIDGKMVLVLVTVLSALPVLVAAYADRIPGWGWVGLGVITTSVLSAGGTDWASRFAAKIGGR